MGVLADLFAGTHSRSLARPLIAHDIRTMPDFAHHRVAELSPMPGVLVVPTMMSIGASIRESQ